MSGHVRELRPCDLGRVLEINQANTPEVGSIDADRLDFLFNESAIALVAAIGPEVVGFALVLPPGSTYDSVNYRWFADRGDDVMYLDRVAIDVDRRGLGFGSALYSSVFDRIAADHAGMTRLGLEVNVEPPNPGSMAFHEALGFTEVGRQRTPYGAVVSLMERPVGSDR
ncbi:MAG: GNAT family N-acetyltransferase [Acidimicrobiia bacterium]|nr:GNAT family N-acetyltransferase [Acidimicrobiia bacterium]